MGLDGCLCEVTHTPAVGTYDTVTFEWLSDRPTTHCRLVPHPDCPMHQPYYLGTFIKVIDDLGGGWVLTQWADGKQWKQWADQIDLRPLPVKHVRSSSKN